MTARSWLMNRHANRCSRCSVAEQVEHPGLHRDVQRARRLVGDQQVRVAARARGRCRPAGAARRTARAGSGSAARRESCTDSSSEADPLVHFGAAERACAAGAARRRCRRRSRGGSVTTAGPGTPRRSGAAVGLGGAAANTRDIGRHRWDWPRCGRDQPGDRAGHRDFARPGLADEPEHLARPTCRPGRRPARQRPEPAAVNAERFETADGGRRDREDRVLGRRGLIAEQAPPPRRGPATARSPSSRPRVLLAWRLEDLRGTAPCSTTRPSYITTTRSARSATTPMSCVISRIADAQPGAQVPQQLEDLGLHGDVERRGRLVGDQQLRLVRHRHGDHDPLQLAAGQLVRVGAEPLAQARAARPGRAAR